MPPLPDPPVLFRYAPVILAAAWGIAELGLFSLVWGVASPADDAVETLAPLAAMGALPASGLIAALLAFCSAEPWRQKGPWLVVAAVLFGLAIPLCWHRSELLVLMLGGVLGNAVWFAGFRVWGRSRLVLRGQPSWGRLPRLSTRQIMLATLAASLATGLLRWLAKQAPDAGDAAAMGMLAIAAGGAAGAATLPLALAIFQSHWAWWPVHLVTNVGATVLLIGGAVVWAPQLRSDQVWTGVFAGELVLAHFALFCAVLRTHGFRFRRGF